MKHNPLFKKRFLNWAVSGCLVALALPMQTHAFSQNPASVFINEIHYDNTGTDTGEAIEIAGPAGTDLSGWAIVLYNGSNGASYDTTNLSGAIPDQQNGFGTVSVDYSSNGIQNGSPDGIALVDNNGNVVQFLSYEGSFVAAGGPADGLTSTDTGVSEASSEPVGLSLQLSGSGQYYQDFNWNAAAVSSFGSVNNSQTFTNDSGNKPSVTLSVSSNAGSEADGAVITVTATASEAVSGDQTVALAVSGAGITSDDYSLSNTTITIPNGQTEGSVTFTVLDDTLVENPETAILTLSNPSSGISLGATISQDIVITSNDSACGQPATLISSVQGSGAATPLSGATVSIEGIVVGDYQGSSGNSLRGFFVQEEDADADGNPATSEGIFVFDGNTTPLPAVDVQVGDRVRATGKPSEYFNMTQLGSVTSVEVCANSQTIPTPASLTMPVPGVPKGDLTAATDAINNYYEAFEGMLVKFPFGLKVAEYFQLERYGQIVLTRGRPRTFTAFRKPSEENYINQQINVAQRKIILDDNNNSQNYALNSGEPLPFPAGGLSTTHRFRGGDSIRNLTGVLHWSYAGQSGTDAWRVRAVNELFSYQFKNTNKRQDTPPAVGGRLKVAGFNVLNYFTTIDTTSSNSSGDCGPDGIQDCRGADSVAELTRQTDKLVSALCKIDADIFGLIELENNAFDSLAAVTAAVNSAGCGPYDYIATGTIGGDAIKVGLIYKTTTVSPSGSYQLLDNSVDSRFLDNKNRPSLAQTFSEVVTGKKLTVVVNHLKSKGSNCNDIGDPDLNDGQGNCNLTRKAAAKALVDWLATDPTASHDPDLLIIGDLNSYAKEDPIAAIRKGADNRFGTADDYVNLVRRFGGPRAYSYVFDGQIGYLDHALASKSLARQVTGTREWHINADEPPSFDYNDTVVDSGEASYEAKPSALPLYQPDQYRTSDHDPVIIGINLR